MSYENLLNINACLGPTCRNYDDLRNTCAGSIGIAATFTAEAAIGHGQRDEAHFAFCDTTTSDLDNGLKGPIVLTEPIVTRFRFEPES